MRFLLFLITMGICGIPIWTAIVLIHQRSWRLGAVYAAVAVLAGIAAADESLSPDEIGRWINPLVLIEWFAPVRNWLENFGPMGLATAPPIRFAQIMFVPSIVCLVIAAQVHKHQRSTANHQQ